MNGITKVNGRPGPYLSTPIKAIQRSSPPKQMNYMPQRPKKSYAKHRNTS